MASSFSDAVARPRTTLVPLAAALLVGCGREDIELARPTNAPVSIGDCTAEVPEGLVSPRPPMGWNGYKAFGCGSELDEAKVREIIDALVASGMQSAGYQYVNLDGCWQSSRSADGQRQFDPEKLPSGIEALSEDVHSRGLLLGVFATDEGCSPEPGGQGHEADDAESYAAWRVDYVKYAVCSGSELGEGIVADLANALRATGRPTVLSLVAHPFQEWLPERANLWRTSDDTEPTFSSLVSVIDATVPLAAYARPGAFNDPDILEIGNGALTAGEQRVQLSVWSILSAPLLAGNDLSLMTDETRAILTNTRVIALDQDPLGLQGALVRRDGDVDILAKPLSGCGVRAVVLWNRGETSADVGVAWDELWLEPGGAAVQDLWTDSPVASSAAGFTVTVPGHDAVALRVTGTEPDLPGGRAYLSDLRPSYVTNGFGPIELDRTNGEDQALDGGSIRLRGAAYDKGLGVHAPSLVRYRLGRACSRFEADVGIDDDQDGQGSVEFQVWADGELLSRSGVLTGQSPARTLSVDVSGKRDLRLFVGIGGDTNSHDQAVWAGARLECASPGTASGP